MQRVTSPLLSPRSSVTQGKLRISSFDSQKYLVAAVAGGSPSIQLLIGRRSFTSCTMFSRKSSSHNLLFRKPITRSVTFTHISTLREEDEDEETQEPMSGHSGLGSNNLMSASMPVFKTPINLEEEEEEHKAGGLKWFRELTNRSKLLIGILCLANFSATVFYSCIAPFFPSYAAAKGATETEVGLIFGCFQLVIFIMSPLWGMAMSKIGAKFMFVTGIMTTGVAAILMGFLEYCPAGRTFVAMCFAIRLVDAIGVSAFMTASFTIIASEFPSAISTVFGACETFNGLGYTLGPPIGGALYQIGGFLLPFAVLGSLVCCCGVASWLLFPSFETSDEKEETPSYRKYFMLPGVWVSLASVFCATLGLGFLDAMYGPHLEAFHITPAVVGAIFLLPSVLYFLCAPFLGVRIDRHGKALQYMVAGAMISGACYLFMGPAPFLNLQGKLWVLIIANIILGLGTCCQLIPPFSKNLEVTIKAGFVDNFETHGMVSGALSSATALGAFVGPAAGGFAVENLGFSWTVTGIAFFQLFVATATVLYMIYEKRPKRRPKITFSTEVDPEEDEVDEANEKTPLMFQV